MLWEFARRATGDKGWRGDGSGGAAAETVLLGAGTCCLPGSGFAFWRHSGGDFESIGSVVEVASDVDCAFVVGRHWVFLELAGGFSIFEVGSSASHLSVVPRSSFDFYDSSCGVLSLPTGSLWIFWWVSVIGDFRMDPISSIHESLEMSCDSETELYQQLQRGTFQLSQFAHLSE